MTTETTKAEIESYIDQLFAQEDDALRWAREESQRKNPGSNGRYCKDATSCRPILRLRVNMLD